MQQTINLNAIGGIPLVEPGDDLAALLTAALIAAEVSLQPGDCLVVAQKIVSKAEGRYVRLTDVTPSADAVALAAEVDKDPRLVELILRESVAVVAKRTGVLIVEHKLGIVHANAGIDRSNIPGDDNVLLLPEDPDASAEKLRTALQQTWPTDFGVVISDSAGRAWRTGITGLAIGCAGLPPLRSMVGRADLFGRPMEITEVALADELAVAAGLLMGQGAEGNPLVLVRGADLTGEAGGAGQLIRPRTEDLFR